MSPEPTPPIREEVEASANAALDECAALTDGDIKVMARWIKQHLTSEPAGPRKEPPEMKLTDAQIKRMAERFLSWKFPENFNPDGGISFQRFGNEGTPHQYRREPVGTNLLDAAQAEGMIRHVLDGVAEPAASVPVTRGQIIDATSVWGAVEEIAKRHKQAEASPNGFRDWCVLNAKRAHRDRATLLALIGAKTP